MDTVALHLQHRTSLQAPHILSITHLLHNLASHSINNTNNSRLPRTTAHHLPTLIALPLLSHNTASKPTLLNHPTGLLQTRRNHTALLTSPSLHTALLLEASNNTAHHLMTLITAVASNIKGQAATNKVVSPLHRQVLHLVCMEDQDNTSHHLLRECTQALRGHLVVEICHSLAMDSITILILAASSEMLRLNLTWLPIQTTSNSRLTAEGGTVDSKVDGNECIPTVHKWVDISELTGLSAWHGISYSR